MMHITNGDAARGVIQRAGIAGECFIWCDVLYEGPVPPEISQSELREVRARFLSGGEPAAFERILAGFEKAAAVLDRRTADDELILWFEHDLFDQLNLIQLLDHLADTRAATAGVSLICIDRFPGRSSFKGLGELSPAELATLIESRKPVTMAHCEAARAAWRAFRSADPRALERAIAQGFGPLPFLAAALRRHLEEFPSTTNGLSRSEAHLLALLAAAPLETWAAFPLMHEGEAAYYITDSSLWQLILELSPLVAIEGDIWTSASLPQATIAITTAGREALDGRLDRVATFGIDRWLGGVHLEGKSASWRWNAAAGRVDQSTSRS